jgi:hypothetical protein
VVLSFMQAYTLDMDVSPFQILQVTYTGCGEVTFCNTLGTPVTETVFVVEGNSYAPATQEGTEIPCGGCEEGTPTLAFGEVTIEGDAPNQQAKVPVLLETFLGQDVSGFQFGIATEAAVVGMEAGAAVDGVGGADFWGFNAVDGGATLGCVIDLEPEPDDSFRALPACTPDQEIAVATVECPDGANGTIDVEAAFSGDLGDPMVALVIDVDGTSIAPDAGDPVSFQLECGEGPTVQFIRGDANQDGVKNVSDGVAIAKAVFGAGSKYPLIEACMDSADTDDDEDVDVAVGGLTSLIEPIMIILLGGIVGFIVIALFMPLVKLIQSVM